MKIEKVLTQTVERIRQINKVKQAEVKLPGSNAGEDGTVVTNTAQLYQTLLKQVKEIPAIREDRVLELAEKIKSGEFIADVQKIATNMLSMK